MAVSENHPNGPWSLDAAGGARCPSRRPGDALGDEQLLAAASDAHPVLRARSHLAFAAIQLVLASDGNAVARDARRDLIRAAEVNRAGAASDVIASLEAVVN